MVTSLALCHRFFIVFSIKNTCPSANALQSRYNRSTFCSCSTIEHFFYHIFKGIGYGSLGVAPLAGLDTKSKNPHGIRGYIMTILKGELKRLKN